MTTTASTPIKVPADYDGDTRQDNATWTNGTWRIEPANGNPVQTHQFGQQGDLPVPGDFQDDNRIELGVLRPADRLLYARPVQGGQTTTYPWATVAYRPVPADYTRIANLSRACIQLAHQLHATSRFAEAVEPSRVARDLSRKLAETTPEYLRSWGDAAHQLASNLVLSGQGAEGIIAAYEGVEVFHELGDKHQLARSYSVLAGVFHHASRYSEAITPALKAVKLFRELVKTDPERRTELGDALIVLSSNLSLSTRHDEAIANAKEALQVFSALGGKSGIARAYGVLAERFSAASRVPEALDPAQRSRDLYKELFDADQSHRVELAYALNRLGGVLAALGQHDRAIIESRLAVEIVRPVNNPDLTGNLLNALAQRLDGAGRLAEAVEPAREAVAIFTELNNRAPAVYLQILAPLEFRFARALHAAGDLPGAEAAIDLAIAHYEILVTRSSSWQAQLDAARAFKRDL